MRREPPYLVAVEVEHRHDARPRAQRQKLRVASEASGVVVAKELANVGTEPLVSEERLLLRLLRLLWLLGLLLTLRHRARRDAPRRRTGVKREPPAFLRSHSMCREMPPGLRSAA